MLAATGPRVPPPVEDHAVFLPNWVALLDELRSRPPAVVVFDDQAPDFGIPEVRTLREAVPRAGLVGWIPADSGDHKLVMKLAALGVDAFFLPTDRRPDAAVLGKRIDEARASSVSRRVVRGLESVVPAELKSFLRGLLEATVRPVSVPAAARLNFSTQRTLRRHLKRAGLPPPRNLIAWCRLFHAAALLENPRRSVLNVMHALDFPSPDALRHQLRRHAGVSPTEVRDGGLDLLVERFVQR